MTRRTVLKRSSSSMPPSRPLSYWEEVTALADDLLKSGAMTSYDAEAFIWAHKNNDLTDTEESFISSLPDSLRKKEWFRRKRHTLTIAAKGSNEYMNVSGVLFSVTSFIMPLLSLLPFVGHSLSQVFKLVDTLINDIFWNATDAGSSAIVGLDLIKHQVNVDAAINIGTAVFLLPPTIAYMVTLPSVHIITSALCNTICGVSMNIIFAIAFWAMCGIEVRHVILGNKLIEAKEAELAELQKNPEVNSNKIHAVKNLIIFQYHQVDMHKRNAVLWGASATLMTASAVISVLVTLGVLASGAATMGIVPAVLALCLAGFAVWRWYINKKATPPLLTIKSKTASQRSSPSMSTATPTQLSVTSKTASQRSPLSALSVTNTDKRRRAYSDSAEHPLRGYECR